MTMPASEAAMRLEVVAAKAAQLAHDLRAGALWPGELSNGLSDIREQLDKVKENRRDD